MNFVCGQFEKSGLAAECSLVLRQISQSSILYERQIYPARFTREEEANIKIGFSCRRAVIAIAAYAVAGSAAYLLWGRTAIWLAVLFGLVAGTLGSTSRSWRGYVE